jgi:hypothetical protein
MIFARKKSWSSGFRFCSLAFDPCRSAQPGPAHNTATCSHRLKALAFVAPSFKAAFWFCLGLSFCSGALQRGGFLVASVRANAISARLR